MKKIQVFFVITCMIFLSWQAVFAKEKLTAQDYYKKGVFLELQNVYGEAIKMYTKAIALDDTLADAYFRRGKLYFSSTPSLCVEAANDFNTVISLEPRNADAYYERGLINFFMLSNEKGLSDMMMAARLGSKKAQEWLNPEMKKPPEKKPQYFHLGNYLPSKGDPVVYFDFNQWELKPTFYALLDEVGTVLKTSLPDVKIIIAGYCDNVGAEKYNKGLSERRAQAVGSYLRAKHGISPERIILRGFGEAGAVATNDTEEGRSINRRVEMLGFSGK
ncbi:MAG: OmpA family protein [Deltaproteobacteria bacterium]|nr:OmpA family protein [Deltaproteobacteria bacterium]